MHLHQREQEHNQQKESGRIFAHYVPVAPVCAAVLYAPNKIFNINNTMQEETLSFQTLGLSDELIQATNEMGFEKPSPIQAQAIPHLLQGLDVIGQAQTGTGKTAAFGLPLLHLIDESQKYPQALIVCPTRELCLQIVKELDLFKQQMTAIQVVAVYGGASIGVQIRDLRRGVQIVVATPGRLIDLIERKAINLEQISYVVLDEADEMLRMGFIDDVQTIMDATPASRLATTRATLLILQNILIDAKKEQLFVRATDLEQTVEVVIEAQIKSPGTITVPARLINNYLQNNPDQNIASLS